MAALALGAALALAACNNGATPPRVIVTERTHTTLTTQAPPHAPEGDFIPGTLVLTARILGQPHTLEVLDMDPVIGVGSARGKWAQFLNYRAQNEFKTKPSPDPYCPPGREVMDENDGLVCRVGSERYGEEFAGVDGVFLNVKEAQALARSEGLTVWTEFKKRPGSRKPVLFDTGGGVTTPYLYPTTPGRFDLGTVVFEDASATPAGPDNTVRVVASERPSNRNRDGYGSISESSSNYRLLQLGARPIEANPLLAFDTDADGLRDQEDLDDDNDGTPDAKDQDRFVYDLSENSDLDKDGIGDATDSDTDGDALPDTTDVDDDNDGKPDWFDEDDDNDGTADAKDFADAAGDRDNDGIGDAKDPTNDPTGLLPMEPPAELRQDFKPEPNGAPTAPSASPSTMTPAPSGSANPHGVEGTDRKDPDYQIVESNGNFVSTSVPSTEPSDEPDSYRLLARLGRWWSGR